jgi:2-polyprenyl-3-methyl-5-hydroxy-6-metoxy-1,4-benzoquinol methylase
MSEGTFQSAHTYWDEQWNSEAGRNNWLRPESDVADFITQLKQRSAYKVIDLGCGVGRHALYLAREGFQVTAVDLSSNGLNHLYQQIEAEGLKIDLRIAAMTDLQQTQHYLARAKPEGNKQNAIPTATIDYLLAWNVIYHGNLDTLEKSLAEIARVLRPGGYFQGTLLSKHNNNFKVGEEIAPDTWINAKMDDKGHPHCYLNATELTTYLWNAGLELMQLCHQEHDKPGSYHWHLLAERRKT